MAGELSAAAVARNYAETLLALANKAEDPAGWGTMLRQVADAIDSDSNLPRFLESPRIAADTKVAVLRRALSDRVPRLFMRFIEALVRNRRQTLIPQIATEYETLRDAAMGVVHARVTVARDTGADEQTAIAERLSRATGRTVVPHLTVDPSIVGGVVVRLGDTVMDGSVRRRLQLLRQRISATR
jgi:F-type H+-transporting ATPase subunit delta